MKELFVELVSGQGIWSALSIVLIFYIIKKEELRDQTQEERETNYQSIIAELSEKLNVVFEIKDMLTRVTEKTK